VTRASPPVGWHKTILQPTHKTTVCAWLNTVVIFTQPFFLLINVIYYIITYSRKFSVVLIRQNNKIQNLLGHLTSMKNELGL